MTSARAYRARSRPAVSARTRDKIMGAVRDLLADGTFHESTVEEVAAKAGVARATLYQHFGSRLALVDAICETFAENPVLVTLRQAVELEDADAALDQLIANAVRFWASEEAILRQLYGAAAIDPSAAALVERQTSDRRGELQLLLARLREAGRLGPELPDRTTLALLLVLTSFETFEELRRRGGLPERDVTGTLQAAARAMLRLP
jgi:AcrR family transcriptional regulator